MRRVLIEDRPPVSGSIQKHRSPSDLRRDQERAEAHQERRDTAAVQADIERRLIERTAAWTDPENPGRDPFLVERQDGSLTPNRGALAYEHQETPGSLRGLHVEKRGAKS